MIVKSYVSDICDRIKNKTALDIGCCASTEKNLLKRHNEYKKTAAKIIGVDYNSSLLRKAWKQGYKNLFQLDITDTKSVESFSKEHGKFDTIVCTDVIEHISNAGLFLDNLREYLTTDDCVMYLTTPNSRSVRWYSMFVRNKIKINPDHMCWYDIFTLTVLLKRHEFKITKTLYHSPENNDAKFLKLEHKDWMSRRLYVIIEKGD